MLSIDINWPRILWISTKLQNVGLNHRKMTGRLQTSLWKWGFFLALVFCSFILKLIQFNDSNLIFNLAADVI